MPYRTGNATRDRMLQARSDFRAGLPTQMQSQMGQIDPGFGNEPAGAQTQPQQVQQQPQQTVQVQQQQTQPQQQVQQQHVPMPNDQTLIMDDKFISTVDSLGKFNDTQPQQAPAQTPQESDAVKAMRAENEKLAKELEELKKSRENDLNELKELQQLRQQKRENDYLAQMNDLGSINSDDARKLISPLLQELDRTRAVSAQKLQETQAAIDRRFAELDKQTKQSHNSQLYNSIFKAHPDLKTLTDSNAYKEIVAAPVAPNSLTTVGEVMARELQAGNADYVIKVLDTVKAKLSAVPNIANVASVGSSNSTANFVSQESNMSDTQLDKLISDVQTGKISRAEFRERRARAREASRLQ